MTESIEKIVSEHDQRILAQRARVETLERDGHIVAAENARRAVDELLIVREQMFQVASKRRKRGHPGKWISN